MAYEAREMSAVRIVDVLIRGFADEHPELADENLELFNTSSSFH